MENTLSLSMTIQILIQKIEFILRDLITFLTQQLAHRLTYLILGVLNNVQNHT